MCGLYIRSWSELSIDFLANINTYIQTYIYTFMFPVCMHVCIQAQSNAYRIFYNFRCCHFLFNLGQVLLFGQFCETGSTHAPLHIYFLRKELEMRKRLKISKLKISFEYLIHIKLIHIYVSLKIHIDIHFLTFVK